MKTPYNLPPRIGFSTLPSLLRCCPLLALLLAPAVWAQQTYEEKGIDQGNYNIKQSIEFGGRFTDIVGNQQTYDTMVNLQQGPRLLNFTTEMRSLDQRGTFFDRLYFSNFGYGGDPNVVSVLRISKNKWYAFDAMFRHDENFWDYSLLANPFNPAAPPANAPAGFNPVNTAPSNLLNTQIVGMTPHYFNTRRNMQNYGLTILPDSKVRVRLGYNHNTNVGPYYNTIHEGTEQFLFGNYSATMTQYRLGVDFRFLPHTIISYDQIWSYYKTDPGAIDQNQQFPVAGGGASFVDLGVSFNGPPCNPTFQSGGNVTATCNAFYLYQTHWGSRTNAPTEQISLQSNPISALQISGKFTYTGSDFNIDNYNQTFTGRVSRSNLANYTESGPMQGRHVASYGDLGATWQITHDFSLVDSFHYGNWNEPAQYSSLQCSFFSTNLNTLPNVPPTFPTNTCASPAGFPTGTPTHTTSSGPDVLVNTDSNFLKQKTITNLIEGQVQISPKAGAYFGYRYTHRVIGDDFFNVQSAIYFPNNAARGNCALVAGALPAGCTPNADGSISYVTPDPTYDPVDTITIDANSAVLGLWWKPIQHLTINLDADLGSADNAFTHLSPRNYQQFRAKAQYRASAWLNFTAYFTTTEGQNPVTDVNLSEHNRNVGFSLSLTPSQKFSTQLGYNFNAISSDLLLCFTSSLAQPNLPPCPGVTGLVQEASPYSSHINTGFLDFLWTPLNPLSVEVGANLSGVTGSEVNLNPLSPIATAPAGPLNSSWYQPYGSVAYRFAKHWTGRARWDYYGYHEDSNGSYQDLFAPRNFHGNLITLSVRFGF